MNERHVLCVNAGSSSIKTALFRINGAAEPERLGEIEAAGIGEDGAVLAWQIDGERHEEQRRRVDEHHEALALILETLHDRQLPTPDVVGHRIVRSPRGRSAPSRLTAELMAALEACSDLAPLHMPFELDAIRAAGTQFPEAVQVVCFDNHFFSGLPPVARRLPIPRVFDEAGIERIGYHGLSYEYIVYRLGQLPARVVLAHLGNGASMAALRDGQAVETTMSYTPTGGLMMGTRSGDLDPGVLIAMARQQHLDLDSLEHMVNYRSGLAGVSDGESSMKELLEHATDEHPANQAVDLFCYAARKHLGAMIAVLGGLDLLVFTGGIGEHAPVVRERILEGLDELGVVLDRRANAAGMTEIHSEYSRVHVRVIPTDEDWVIARYAAALLGTSEEMV